LNNNTGVKVVSEKSHSDVLKLVDDSRKNQKESDHNDPAVINLSMCTVDRKGCYLISTEVAPAAGR
jgi:hypothetical protein